MKYPDLPTTIMGAGGPITVKVLPRTKVLNEEVWGSWDDSTRVIEIESRATKAHQWRCLYHEIAHSMLADTGLENMFADNIMETICDATATCRFRERFG